jgi:DNA polymerase-3 subunit alpha
VTIYQEQYMEIARKLGGFSPMQADDLRKAISKKDRKLMDTLREPLISGLRSTGIPDPVCRKLWSNFEATGDYSFNKSHAACYALISYRTAYLKANYPVEYMAAVISSVMNTKDKVPFYVNECHMMGIEVLPPDVNESEVGFTVAEGKIRFGLNAVKGVGKGAIESILAARESGPFASLYDFCTRVDSSLANKRTLEALIKGGAFDSTGASRRGMLEALPAAVTAGERARKDHAQGQGGLFDHVDDEHLGAMNQPPIPADEFEHDVRLRFEKEALGLWVSSHPLQDLRSQLISEVDMGISRLVEARDGAVLWTGGVISGLQRRATRGGGLMAKFRLEDVDGGAECIAWPAKYEEFRDLLVEDNIVKVRGRIDRRSEDDVQFMVVEVVPFTGVSASRPLTLTIDANRVQAGLLDELRQILGGFPGQVPVVVHMVTGDSCARLRVGDSLRVSPASSLYAELKALLGERCLETPS